MTVHVSSRLLSAPTVPRKVSLEFSGSFSGSEEVFTPLTLAADLQTALK